MPIAPVGRRLQRHKLWVSLSLVALTLALLGPVTFVDFDPLHDSAIIVGAVGVHDGLAIHGDVSTYYGPISPWLISGLMWLPISPAVAARLLTLVSYCLITFLLADLGRKRHNASPVNSTVSVASALVWLALSDIPTTGPMRPWTTVQMILGFALGIYLIQRAAYLAQNKSTRRPLIFLALAGASMSIGAFARPAIGFFCLAVVVAYSLLGLYSLRRFRTLFFAFFAGVAGASFTVCAALVMTSSLPEFIDDCFFQVSAIYRPTPDSYLLFAIKLGALYILPLSLFLASTLFLLKRKRLGLVPTLLISAILGILIAASLFTVQWRAPTDFRASLFSFDLWYRAWSGIGFYFILTLALTLCLGLQNIVSAFKSKPTQPLPYLLGALALFSLAFTLEVYPDFTGRHVYWALIFCVLSSVTFLRMLFSNSASAYLPLFVIPAFCLGLFAVKGAYYNQLSVERVRLDSGTIADGMWVRPEVATIIKDTAVSIDSLNGEKAVFDSNSAFPAIIFGHYNSVDRFWSCAMDRDTFEERLQTNPPMVVEKSPSSTQACPLFIGQRPIDSSRYTLISSNTTVDIFRVPAP